MAQMSVVLLCGFAPTWKTRTFASRDQLGHRLDSFELTRRSTSPVPFAVVMLISATALVAGVSGFADGGAMENVTWRPSGCQTSSKLCELNVTRVTVPLARSLIHTPPPSDISCL